MKSGEIRGDKLKSSKIRNDNPELDEALFWRELVYQN